MLTDKEQQIKFFMINKFVPALHQVISEKNPTEYLKWNKNCCRQSAIFGAYWLQDCLPEYRFTVWDGIFDDIVNDRKVTYNHAWIFAKHKESGKKLFVDLGRIHSEFIFDEVERNAYPKIKEYKDLKELKREQLDWEKMFKDDMEYYTGYSGQKVIQEISKKILLNA